MFILHMVAHCPSQSCTKRLTPSSTLAGKTVQTKRRESIYSINKGGGSVGWSGHGSKDFPPCTAGRKVRKRGGFWLSVWLYGGLSGRNPPFLGSIKDANYVPTGGAVDPACLQLSKHGQPGVLDGHGVQSQAEGHPILRNPWFTLANWAADTLQSRLGNGG